MKSKTRASGVRRLSSLSPLAWHNSAQPHDDVFSGNAYGAPPAPALPAPPAPPAPIGFALEGQPAAVEAELRLAAAMKMYELGRLSSGAAVQLVGLPKPAFLTKLADYAPGCRVLNGIFIKDMLVLRSA